MGETDEDDTDLTTYVTGYAEFVADYNRLKCIVSDIAVSEFSSRRLRLLEAQYDFHSLVNSDNEKEAMRVSVCYSDNSSIWYDNSVVFVSNTNSLLDKTLIM